ncbi:MAG: hypothetical protein ABSF44_15730 [Candidatus Bathyarchaeia archaeon]|jgi:hypothetical protein
MRLNFRVKIVNITFFAMVAKTQRLEGVSSLQKDGKHIVMFDLENCSLVQAEKTLRRIQRKYHLSDIFIVSDVEKSYRAWCYSKVGFVTFLKILLDVKFLDWNFFYWTVKRGKATLRTSTKKGRQPQRIVSVLTSYSVPISNSCEKVVYDTGLTKRGFTVLLGD